MKGTVLILAMLGTMLVVGSGEASGASSIAGSHEVAIAEKRAVLKTRSDESRPPRPKGKKERHEREERQREKKPRPEPKPPNIDPPIHPKPPRPWPRPVPPAPIVEVIYYDRARYAEEPYRFTDLAGIASLSLATASAVTAFGEEPHKTLAVSSIFVGAGTITSALMKGEGRSWVMAAGVASFALGWFNLITSQQAVISTTASF